MLTTSVSRTLSFNFTTLLSIISTLGPYPSPTRTRTRFRPHEASVECGQSRADERGAGAENDILLNGWGKQ